DLFSTVGWRGEASNAYIDRRGQQGDFFLRATVVVHQRLPDALRPWEQAMGAFQDLALAVANRRAGYWEKQAGPEIGGEPWAVVELTKGRVQAYEDRQFLRDVFERQGDALGIHNGGLNRNPPPQRLKLGPDITTDCQSPAGVVKVESPFTQAADREIRPSRQRCRQWSGLDQMRSDSQLRMGFE